MITKENLTIAITMGDAAGIGPEIIVKALASEEINSICCPLVIGDAAIMRETIRSLGKALKLHSVEALRDVQVETGVINILDLHNLNRSEVAVGKVCIACGRAAMEYIKKAAQLALKGKVRALVTAPINKEATKKAGYADLGHLEFLAKLTGVTEYATMLVTNQLRVVHLTTHYSTKDACDMVTKERVLARLKLTHESFRRWGIKLPRIAVAALNPHAGEGGLMGVEEIKEIGPAVKAAKELGIDATGPFPADSIFNRALNGEFDVVIAMYHDQGHIPIKVHGFEKSVSVALGLPLIRTSVDHGTAFNIAGKGIANSESLEEAIKIAVGLSEKKRLV